MADGIQIAPESTGPTLDTKDMGARGHREITVLGDPTADAALQAVVATDPAALAYGAVGRAAPPDSPQTSFGTTASVAAGSSTSIDSSQINVGKTGKLMYVEVGSALPLKVQLQTVLNGVATTVLTAFAWDGNWDWSPPSKEFVKVAQDVTAGLDGFRCLITNMDPSKATDVYATFLYDEV